MKASAGAWKLWLFSTGGSVVVILLVVSLFRVPAGTPGPAKGALANAVPRVELAAHEDELLIEEMALRDPTPLFLPTVWNAAEDALAMNAPREPGESFQDYAPFYTFSVNELNINFSNTSKVPVRPLDALALDSASGSLFGFGQIDGKIEPLRPRRGFLEVVSADDGQLLMRQPLTEGVPVDQGNWQPLEFLVAVNAAGVVGPPVLSESSRVGEVDSFFKEYLLKVLHIGERLAPGFYRISIGP
jgi:hypothetical protein